jgi:hypothetical protein
MSISGRVLLLSNRTDKGQKDISFCCARPHIFLLSYFIVMHNGREHIKLYRVCYQDCLFFWLSDNILCHMHDKEIILFLFA